jgi:hypothetical protein
VFGIRQLLKLTLLGLIVFSLLVENAASKSTPSMVYGINVALADSNEEADAEPRKDYYLNVGSKDGVRKGTQLLVYRKLTTTNEIEKHQVELHVPVGKLIVVHTEPTNSIAKLMEMRTDLAAPVLDVDGVMVGDLVEVTANVTVQNTQSTEVDERMPASVNVIRPKRTPLNTQYGF